MGYEVDVLGVGKESKSGDANVLRWGNLHGSRSEQKVVLIDGGFQETGEDVVSHIKRHYGTTLVDAVVSTHPDQDHVKRIHHALYVAVRDREGREASPSAAVIDSQSAKGAQKGGLRSTRRASMRARRSRGASATSSSIHSACC